MARLFHAVGQHVLGLRCSWQKVWSRPVQSVLAQKTLKVPSQAIRQKSTWSREVPAIAAGVFALACAQRSLHSEVRSEEDKSERIPVILLSGFLGAGKTTMLEHLLKSDHGLRLGIIVNDLASVNVDARVLENAVQQSGAKSMELANGCVCCSASDDLLRSILELCATPSGKARQTGSLDAIVVELSGVAEPRAARTVLDDLAYTPRAYMARTVTVVDAAAFAADFNVQMPEYETPQSEERLAVLLAEQIEDADILVLNKADLATAAELSQAEAMVSALNRNAKQLVVEHGRVEPELLLGLTLTRGVSSISRIGRELSDTATHGHGHGHDRGHSHGHDRGHSNGHDGGRSHGHDHGHSHRDGHAHGQGHDRDHDRGHSHGHDRGHGHGHGHGHSHGDGHGHGHSDNHGHREDEHCTDPSHDHRSSAERRFGIKSFVYESQRPFNRERFIMEVKKWQRSWTSMGKSLKLQEESVAVLASANEQVSSDSPFAPVLRSKGLLWVDVHPDSAFYWGHAGRCLHLKNVGRWGEEDVSALSGNDKSGMAPSWPPRTELVFIGTGIDETAVRATLDKCLVTEKEFTSVPMPSPPRQETAGSM